MLRKHLLPISGLTLFIFLVVTPVFAGHPQKNLRRKGMDAQSQGEYEQAVRYYRKALKENPHYPVLHNDLGIVFERMGKTKKAEWHYHQALDEDPSYAKAYTNLAMLYESQGRLSDALTYWKRRSELGDPNDPWTQKASSRVRELAGRVEESSREIGISSDESIVGQAESHSYHNVLSRNREIAQAHYDEGRKNEKKKKYVEALHHYSISIHNDPWNPQTLEAIRRVRFEISEAHPDDAHARWGHSPLAAHHADYPGHHAGQHGHAHEGSDEMHPAHPEHQEDPEIPEYAEHPYHEGHTVQPFVVTGDLDQAYVALGESTAMSEEGDLMAVNAQLQKHALAKGADGLIKVHYASKGKTLYGYGTVVKIK